MVGYLQTLPTEEESVAEQAEDFRIQSFSDIKKPPSPNDPLFLSPPELEAFSSSFADSFLDFDCVNSWFVEGNIGLHGDNKMAESGENPVDVGSGKSDHSDEIGGDDVRGKDANENELGERVESFMDLGQENGEIGITDGSVELGNKLENKEIVDAGVSRRVGLSEDVVNFECLIEERMGKVNLGTVLNASMLDNSLESGEILNTKADEGNGGDVNHGNELNGGETINSDTGAVTRGIESSVRRGHEVPNDEDEVDDDSESESESSSSSSSSSTSSSDAEDGDEGEEGSVHMVDGNKLDDERRISDEGEIEVEEGEILSHVADETVAWDVDEDDDGGSGIAAPITSKNELKVLPHVPSVNVTLQPHHQTLPVGVVLSIIGAQVIVEGIEKHSPLNEGSILWMTESRLPLGIVEEIFGPVKNPYYVVRYNSECEVPAEIHQGTAISFVSEFANHVLNDKNLYQKGYDASGENDEELTDELEFSDDEKEAEYKRMLKMKKRGTNESVSWIKRKDKRMSKSRMGNQQGSKIPVARTPSPNNNLLVTEDQFPVSHVQTPLNKENNTFFSGIALNMAGNDAIASPFPVRSPGPGFIAPNGILGNGFLGQQPFNPGFSGGLMANYVSWMLQNQPYQLNQMPLPTSLAFQQPNNTIPGWPLNLRPVIDQSNFRGTPAFAPPWPGFLDQNVLNQSQFGMGSVAQPSPPMNVPEQVFQYDGSCFSSSLQPPPVNAVNSQNFRKGRGGRGRGHHRGGRYGGGRGTSQGHRHS